MGGLILFVVFLGFVAWLFRYLRNREIEAFREADISVFQEFAANRDDIKALPAREEVVATSGNVVSLQAAKSQRRAETRIVARDAVFDEIHRHFLESLEKVLDSRFRVFVHVPLTDFLRVEAGSADLRHKSVSFLVCERGHMRIACGIMLQGSSPTEMAHFRFLADAFAQIDKPLITFPMLASYSAREIREKIGHALKDSLLTRICPRCGSDMTMRKAVKGINAGKTFWVCKQFPDCKGIVRMGRW